MLVKAFTVRSSLTLQMISTNVSSMWISYNVVIRLAIGEKINLTCAGKMDADLR